MNLFWILGFLGSNWRWNHHLRNRFFCIFLTNFRPIYLYKTKNINCKTVLISLPLSCNFLHKLFMRKCLCKFFFANLGHINSAFLKISLFHNNTFLMMIDPRHLIIHFLSQIFKLPTFHKVKINGISSKIRISYDIGWVKMTKNVLRVGVKLYDWF